MMKDESEDWLYEIKPKGALIDFNFKEIWRYRDLLLLFVKRDIATVYKQTILGPLWFFIQPIFTSLIFTLVFNKIGGVDTDTIPAFLFNLAGVTLWNYFKEGLNNTSNTFKTNASLFGKVYFPRVIMPLSKSISELLKFGIQLFIFIIALLVYRGQGVEVSPSQWVFAFPIYVLMIILLSVGLGMTFSALTTKYRDLSKLISFGLSLVMYISAVMYPLQEAQRKMPEYYWIIKYNPLAHIIDGYRNLLLGIGQGINMQHLLLQLGSTLVVFLIGLAVFNKTEKTFIDTV